MNSLNHELKRLFRIKTEILESASLNDCLQTLILNEKDLILTGSFVAELIQNQVHKAVILNVDQFGNGEPKENWVDEILKVAYKQNYQRVIAIGGGAVIDIAKLCIFNNGRTCKSLFENKDNLIKGRELIAIPTTCGTGSEVTNVAVIEFIDLDSKLGLQIDQLFPDKAILIGELLNTLPLHVFVVTSIDALSHAIESYLSLKATAYTKILSETAIRGIISNLKELRETEKLPVDLTKSLICANMAGISFSLAGCATMHALSFPLGANYHLAHGEAVYAVLGSTLNYYKKMNIDLSMLEAILNSCFNEQNGIESLLQLLSDIMPCPDFNELNIKKQQCAEMAINVFENQQRLLVNSPKVLTINDLTAIYINCR